MTSEWKIRRRDALLSDLARGLAGFWDRKMGCLEVVLKDVHGEPVLAGDVPIVLGFLADDIYYNAESDWSDAYSLEVRTM